MDPLPSNPEPLEGNTSGPAPWFYPCNTPFRLTTSGRVRCYTECWFQPLNVWLFVPAATGIECNELSSYTGVPFFFLRQGPCSARQSSLGSSRALNSVSWFLWISTQSRVEAWAVFGNDTAARPSEPRPVLIIDLLLLWRPDNMVHTCVFIPEGKTISSHIPRRMCHLSSLFWEYRCALFFSFPEVCVSENHFRKPSKYLERNAVGKCATLYTDPVNLWLANLYFPILPEKLINCFAKNIKDISKLNSLYFLIFPPCPGWKMISFRSSSITMTFSELDKKPSSNT